jgi:hypothetical protein
LNNVQLNSYPAANCQSLYAIFDINKQICAGDTATGRSTCQGDSGGGVYVYDTILQKFVVVGISSQNYKCGQPTSPG